MVRDGQQSDSNEIEPNQNQIRTKSEPNQNLVKRGASVRADQGFLLNCVWYGEAIGQVRRIGDLRRKKREEAGCKNIDRKLRCCNSASAVRLNTKKRLSLQGCGTNPSVLAADSTANSTGFACALTITRPRLGCFYSSPCSLLLVSFTSQLPPLSLLSSIVRERRRASAVATRQHP